MATGAPALAWLYRIASRRLADYQRRGAVERKLQRALSMERPRLNGEDAAMIELLADDAAVSLLAELPLDQRDAVAAYVVRDEGYAELAAAQHTSEAAVRQRVSRGLGTLRRRMGGRRMSDFVTELRREVVGAHARHHVSAARTRRRRRRPILAGAVALAALLLRGRVGRALDPAARAERRAARREGRQRRRQPHRRSVARRLALGHATSRRRQVVRIDPARRKIIARVHARRDARRHHGRRGERLGTGRHRRRRGADLAYRPRDEPGQPTSSTRSTAPASLWPPVRSGPCAWDHSAHQIARLSLTGRRLGELPLRGGMTLAAGGRWIWSASPDGTVARIDARDGRIAHRWPLLVPNQSASGDATGAMVADRTGAWLADTYGRRILRLEGDKVTRVLRTGDIKPMLASVAGELWVVASDEPGGPRIERIDPRTGRVTATVELGTHYPRALVPVRGGLWVIAGDGTAVLIDT